MKLMYGSGNDKYLVDVTGKDRCFTIEIDGQRHVAEIVSAKENGFIFQMDGQKYKTQIASTKEEHFINLNGRNFILKRIDAEKQRRKVQTGSSEDLKAPMPGKILKVMVKNDDLVEIGQPLIIMEAMKMEYTIKSHKNGKVIKLSLKEGDQVNLGQMLLDIEEQEISDQKS